ncbi:UNVERIFIED_CONTAM: hypothetical protein Sradi_1558000 [Sesamum radiatum]|uniref:Uncharacterized protein n=1 Tax=Sesamum radiatum TaxID=300843 RepID=A0AAW2U8V3_SESRA
MSLKSTFAYNIYIRYSRHTRFAACKELFRAKVIKGSSVHDHDVNMLSLVEKLSGLNMILDNDTYIDVFLQLLPPPFDQFVVNYNMNGLEKSIPELINMLIYYEVAVKKSMLGAPLISKSNGKKTEH